MSAADRLIASMNARGCKPMTRKTAEAIAALADAVTKMHFSGQPAPEDTQR